MYVTFKPEKKKKKRESRVLNYVPALPLRENMVVLFILAYSWCHVTTMWQKYLRRKNANRIIIAQLLITITQSYCNYSYLLAAPAL